MKRAACSLYGFLFVFAVMLCGVAYAQDEGNVVFQTSTINALMEGGYDGETTFEELGRHGDFGIGTFNALDGEMIELDGNFYQVKADGVAYPVGGAMKTPFAEVAFFKSDTISVLTDSVDLERLEKYLDGIMPSVNLVYAVKVEGTFGYVRTRSVARQKPPYPRLVDAVKDQATFEFKDCKGTLVGFRFPDFLKGLNVPGYHFHFLTSDRKAGGHVLALETGNIKIEAAELQNFVMTLPEGRPIGGDSSEEVEKVEKGVTLKQPVDN